MKAKRLTIVASLALLVALALFWKPLQASFELKKEIAFLRAKIVTRDTKLQKQAAQLDRLREQQDALNKQLAALHQQKQTSGTASSSLREKPNSQTANADDGKKEFIRRSLEDPQMKESWRTFETTKLRQIYGDFLRDQNFSPEQSARFVELTFDQGERDMEDGTRFLNGDQDPAEKSSFTKEQTDQEMRALIGDEAFEKYDAYDKTTAERSALAEVREQLGRTSTPLENDQADTLLQIMLEERERTPLTALDPRVPGTSRDKFIAISQGDSAEQFYQAETDFNRRILSRAGSTLTSEQYEALENRLNQHLQMTKILVEMALKAATPKQGR